MGNDDERRRVSAPSAHAEGGSFGAPDEPLHAIFDTAAARYPDRPCLDFLGRTQSYREVAHEVARASKGLMALGVRRGVNVGLCLPNSPYYVIAYFAILKAGGTVVNFNPLYSAEQIEFQVRDSQIRIMITLDLHAVLHKVEQSDVPRIVVCRFAAALPPLKRALFTLFKRRETAAVPKDDRYIPFAELIDNDGAFSPPPIDPHRDLAVIQYTGGTTGTPKGAMLSHDNLRANTAQVRILLGALSDGQERFVAVIPFFHVYAMTVLMNLGLATGSQLILLPRFDVDHLLRAISRKKATLIAAVPTVYAALANHPRVGEYDFSALRHCVSGGAPLPLAVKTAFENMTGRPLIEGYGLSEASPVVSFNPPDGVQKAGSIGPALAGTEIEVRDLETPTAVCARKEKGEIVVRGPQVMLGYWNSPEETAKVMDNGWLRTGDVGYMDEDGYVFLIDRLKDIIITGGYKVYPRNIEEVLMRHRDVEEATVIAVDHPLRGQVPKAFVKMRAGADRKSVV